MAILNKSVTAEIAKNRWATQWGCFLDAQHLYGKPFSVDACAEPETAKVKRFYVSPQWAESNPTLKAKRGQRILGVDALQNDWPADWWCNPPFDHKQQFIQHAIAQQRAGRPGMMLLPYSPVAAWWRSALGSGVIVYEPDGRYNFMEPDGETKQSGANFDSVLVAFPTMRLDVSPRIPFPRGIHKADA